MKWMQIGRAVAVTAASLAMTVTMVSCTNTKLGYVFALSQQTNNQNGGQVYSFRVDTDSGALSMLSNTSTTQNSPTSSGGSGPTRVVLANGGTFMYILNTSTNPASIALFTIGGDGTIFYQRNFFSKGNNPQDIHLSSDGAYLYVADQTVPDPAQCPAGYTSVCGDITVFSIDPSTGRLSPVSNSNDPNNVLNYFPVGPNPVRIYSSGTFVYTLDNIFDANAGTHNPSQIFVYQEETTGQNPGMLTLNENTTPQSTGPDPVAVNGSGSSMYIADAFENAVYQYNISSGVPQPISGVPQSVSLQGATGPTDLAVEPTGKYLYVAAAGTNSLVGFALNVSSSPGALMYFPTNGSSGNTSSGSNPQCMAITGGREFLYTANYNDGSVSGVQIDATTGQLKNATNNVKTAGQATCLVFSSRTN